MTPPSSEALDGELVGDVVDALEDQHAGLRLQDLAHVVDASAADLKDLLNDLRSAGAVERQSDIGPGTYILVDATAARNIRSTDSAREHGDGADAPDGAADPRDDREQRSEDSSTQVLEDEGSADAPQNGDVGDDPGEDAPDIAEQLQDLPINNPLLFTDVYHLGTAAQFDATMHFDDGCRYVDNSDRELNTRPFGLAAALGWSLCGGCTPDEIDEGTVERIETAIELPDPLGVALEQDVSSAWSNIGALHADRDPSDDPPDPVDASSDGYATDEQLDGSGEPAPPDAGAGVAESNGSADHDPDPEDGASAPENGDVPVVYSRPDDPSWATRDLSGQAPHWARAAIEAIAYGDEDLDALADAVDGPLDSKAAVMRDAVISYLDTRPEIEL